MKTFKLQLVAAVLFVLMCGGAVAYALHEDSQQGTQPTGAGKKESSPPSLSDTLDTPDRNRDDSTPRPSPAPEKKKRSVPEGAETFIGVYSPEKGSTVGVAMPVSITFNKPIPDKAAVERELKVTSSPAVKGTWHWMKDRSGKDRVDYRPQEFWQPGTQVTLKMTLKGVKVGDLYGTQDRTVRFTIGDAVTSTVDVDAKQMTVKRNGTVVRTLPVSTGKAGWETWGGTMVVLGKIPVMDYTSDSLGITDPDEFYDLKDVEWNVRLTPSGTLSHAAPWNSQIGKFNTSHGCINMTPGDAKWFYDQVQLGDPVTVINSKDTVAVNNGYGAWNVDWTTWKQGSALK